MVGDVAGTIAYMPPEQVRDFKEVRPPSDIYAVGMTAYSLLTGAHALDISPKAGISETVKAIFEKPIIPISSRVPDVPKARLGSFRNGPRETGSTFRWRNASIAGEMRSSINLLICFNEQAILISLYVFVTLERERGASGSTPSLRKGGGEKLRRAR